jgi:hypothetical protein
MRLPARWIELIGATSLVVAQTGGTAAQGAEPEKPSWQLGVRFAVPVRYDDNSFRLDREDKRRLAFLSRDDARSGRFAHMESTDDVIPVPTFEVDLEGPGFAGRKLELEAEAGYYANLFNARRRNVQLEFEIALSGPDSRLRLISEWQPRYFPNNYLADAVDDDADGEITPGERRYKAGRSREGEVALLYRHRLVRQTRTRPIEVLAEFGPGYTRTTYATPFAGRTRGGLQALAEFTVEGEKWQMELDYGFERLLDEPNREIMILDETEVGRNTDFKGNRVFDDEAVRAFEVVDRSRREHEVTIQLEGRFGDRFEAEVNYGRRLRYYTSVAPFDDNRGRRDTRNVFELELDAEMRSGFHVILGGWRGVQWTTRPGERRMEDYRQTVVLLGLEYEFGCPSITGRPRDWAWGEACRSGAPGRTSR